MLELLEVIITMIVMMLFVGAVVFGMLALIIKSLRVIFGLGKKRNRGQ